MVKPILKAKNITKIFGRGCKTCLDDGSGFAGNKCPACGSITACRDISFDLFPNEVLGIVGESGSGKSTLVRMLYFDIEPTKGEMFLEFDGDGAGSNGYHNTVSLTKGKKKTSFSAWFTSPRTWA